MANFSDPYQLLKINGKPIGLAADRGISVQRTPIDGGGEIDVDWNGNAEGNAQASWRKWIFRISISDAVIPPALEKAMWKGQIASLETAFEERLDGYVVVADQPRLAPPDVPEAMTVEWDPVPGSFSFVLADGSDEVDGVDGTNVLPDGITPEMVETTVFRNRFQVIVENSFDGSIDVDRWSYGGNITYRER